MEEITMYNYTIKVSQLDQHDQYEYIGKLLIESDVSMFHLQQEKNFDDVINLFEEVINIIERQNDMLLLADGEYNFTDTSIECFGIIMEQYDEIYCLQLELIE